MQQMLSMWALTSLEIPRCIVHFFFYMKQQKHLMYCFICDTLCMQAVYQYCIAPDDHVGLFTCSSVLKQRLPIRLGALYVL